jgi:hypothetical protein
MACDDMVLAQTENPRAYAQCLLSLAEKNLLRRGMALAQAAVGRMRQTTARVLQILDARRSCTLRVWKPAPWVVGAFSVACLVSSAHAPKLVAFEDAASAAPRSATIVMPARTQANTSKFGARVVAATFAEHELVHPVARPRTLLSAAKRAKPASVQVASQQHDLGISAAAQTAAIRANVTLASSAMPKQAVFVFVEARPYGNPGNVVWHVSVWRVTMTVPRNPGITPANPHVVTANPRAAAPNSSKSI